jgi:hypothetical protein
MNSANRPSTATVPYVGRTRTDGEDVELHFSVHCVQRFFVFGHTLVYEKAAGISGMQPKS